MLWTLLHAWQKECNHVPVQYLCIYKTCNWINVQILHWLSPMSFFSALVNKKRQIHPWIVRVLFYVQLQIQLKSFLLMRVNIYAESEWDLCIKRTDINLRHCPIYISIHIYIYIYIYIYITHTPIIIMYQLDNVGVKSSLRHNDTNVTIGELIYLTLCAIILSGTD